MSSVSQQTRDSRDQNAKDGSEAPSEEQMASKDKVQKLVYQPRNSAMTVELFASSLSCLSPDTYLNDEVIQFYSAYLLAECCECPKRMHVFDNLFHVRLCEMFSLGGKKDKDKNKDKDKDKDKEANLLKDKQNGNGTNAAGDAEKRGPWTIASWNQLKNWYNHINVFEKDFLIFPVCREKHWFVIIVCYPNEVRDCDGKSYSPVSDSSARLKPIPGIMILDSVQPAGQERAREVRYFLDFEWRTRCTVIKDFFYHNLPTYSPVLPKQTNTSDCGIFMLAYLRAFVQQPEKFYRLVRKSSDKHHEADLFELVNNSLTHCGREAIKSLIHRQCLSKK